MFICPSCGSGMKFDPGQQKLVCENCRLALSPHEYKESAPLKAEERKLDEEEAAYYQDESSSGTYRMDHDTIFSSAYAFDEEGESAKEEGTYSAYLMTCPQCGGQLLTTDETAATFCSFCGSSVLLGSRVSREKRPDYIIPFKIDKEESEAAYRALVKKSLFAPKYLKSEDNISRFRGIYMPYWVYSFDREGKMAVPGRTSRRRGDYIYTEEFSLFADVDASFEGLSYDASSSFADNLSEAIAPFEFDKTEGFEPSYLSGFYADTNDVDSSVYSDDARDVASEAVADNVLRKGNYAAYGVGRDEIKRFLSLDEKKPSLAMYPVWFLASRTKDGDRVSYAVVNGQTGKAAAELPVDKKKLIAATVILAVPIFVILNLLFTLTPAKALIATIILGIIGMVITNRQLNLIYCFENHLDDEGYLSAHRDMLLGRERQKDKPKGGFAQDEKSKKLISLLVCFVLILFFNAVYIPFGGIIELLLMIVMIGLLTGALKSPGSGGKKKKSSAPAAAAPFPEKLKTLWKPIAGVLAAFITVVISPVSDIYYYGAAIAAMVLVAWSFWDILGFHNRLTTRPLPQFDKRGGEEYGN